MSTCLPETDSDWPLSQRPSCWATANRGNWRSAAMITPTVHSAVAGVCAPRALHNVTPRGRYGRTWSAPADMSCTTFRLGRPFRTWPARCAGTPNGITTNSTSAAESGSCSPPFHTSARRPSGISPNASGGSGSHTRVTVASGQEWGDVGDHSDREGGGRGRAGLALQPEFLAPVLRDEVTVVRVLADPAGDVRAVGQHRQVTVAG